MPTLSQIQSFRTKARARGFSDARINAEIDRKQREGQGGVSQPTQQIQQPRQRKTLGGFAQNAAQDILDFAVNTPIEAYKSILGAGFEASRAVSMAGDRRRMEKKRKELEKITRAFTKEKDEKKKKSLIAKSRLISKELDQLTQGAMKTTRQKDPFVSPEELPESVGEMGKGILRNVGRMFGIEQDESGKVVFNLETAIQSAYEKPVSTALMARDIGKGVFGRKGKITGAVDDAGAGVLDDVGADIRGGSLKPKIKASPFYSEEVALLQKLQKELKLKGSVNAQLKQLPKLFRKTQDDLVALLKKGDKTKKGALSKSFLDEIDNANYNLDDLQFGKAVESEMAILEKLDGSTALKQYKQLDKYRKLLKSTRKKLDNGTTLLPKEEARLASFNALKDSIDTVSPEIRAMNTLQNQMFNLSEALVRGKGKGGFGIGQFKLPAGVSQTARDVVGRGVQKTAGLGGKVKAGVAGVGEKLPSVPTGTGLVSGATAGKRQVSVGEMGEQVEPTEDIMDREAEAHPIFGKSSKKEVLLQAFRSGMNNDQLEEIEGLYDKFAVEEEIGEAGTEGERKERMLGESGLRALDEIEGILEEDGGVVIKAAIPGQLGARSYDSAAFRAVEALLRARSGAAVPEAVLPKRSR